MEVIAEGTVVAARAGTEASSCAFPSICVLPNGRWLCGLRAAPTKGGNVGQHVRVTWSDDEGARWAEPRAPFDPPKIDGRPGLLRGGYMTAMDAGDVLAALIRVDHSDPDLPFFNEETEGLLDTRIFLARSSDAGETWTEPTLMDAAPFECPVPLTGAILRLADGTLACQFELNKHYYDRQVWQHSSVLMFSRDGGRTWPEHSIASNDPTNRFFYWDQRPGVLADGTVLDLFWTYDNRAAAYLDIHARASQDGGRTWGEMRDTGVPGQPAPPICLLDGRIAMVYVDRTDTPTIKLRTSDDGRTWPEATEMVLHVPQVRTQTERKGSMQDAWAEMARFSVGLPATALLDGGDLLVVYYSGLETDVTDIRWVRVA